MNSDESPLGIWRRKLEHFQLELAITADPALKFELKEKIGECKRRIRELEVEPIQRKTELKPHTIAENPFRPLSGAIEDINKIFGREREIRDIFEYLNSGSSVAIIGDSALGKSSILKAIAHYTPQRLNFTRIPIYMSLGNLQKDDDFYSELCKLIEIKGKVLKGYSLYRELEKYKILLLLDIVESLAEKGFSIQLRRQLRDLANHHNSPLKLVVAARRSLDSLFTDSGQDSPFENICQEIYLKPWNEGVIRNFINHRLANNSMQFAEEEIQLIIKESKGYPQKLMKSCFNLYRMKLS